MLTKSEDDTQNGFCICNEQKKTILSNCVNIDSKTKGGQEKLYKASVFYSLLEKHFLMISRIINHKKLNPLSRNL